MARTESITYTVSAGEEQDAIQVQQVFGWNLLNTQEILSETATSHLESREPLFGDPELWSVTTTTKMHYLRLTFSRELDLPNLDNLRRLEQQYFELHVPPPPKPVNWAVFGCLGALTCGILWVIGLIIEIMNGPKKKAWSEAAAEIYAQRRAILAEAGKY